MLIGGGIGALVGGIAAGAIYYAANQQTFDKTEVWVAVIGGAAAGAFVGSGLGILTAATTTVTAAATATAMVSGGSSAAITEAMYMAENQDSFKSTPYLTNAASEYLMMNKSIGKDVFLQNGCHTSYVEVAKSERIRTGVGYAILGQLSGFTTAVSNWYARNIVKKE